MLSMVSLVVSLDFILQVFYYYGDFLVGNLLGICGSFGGVGGGWREIGGDYGGRLGKTLRHIIFHHVSSFFIGKHFRSLIFAKQTLAFSKFHYYDEGKSP